VAILDPSKGRMETKASEYVAAPRRRKNRGGSHEHPSGFDRWPFDLFGQVGPPEAGTVRLRRSQLLVSSFRKAATL
jgi:hypothetical protein